MKDQPRAGITLVEVMVGTAILCILSLGFSTVMSSSVKVQNYVFGNGTGRISEIDGGRQAIDAITEELKTAYSQTIIEEIPGEVLQYTCDTYDSSSHKVVTKTGRISLVTDAKGKGNVIIQRGPSPQAFGAWTFESTKSYGKGTIKDIHFTIQDNFDQVSGGVDVAANSRKKITVALTINALGGSANVGGPANDKDLVITGETVAGNIRK